MGRSPCCEKGHTNKGAWTKEEDQRLISYISAHGEGNWRSLPKAAGLMRCGKSCRLRWINYLRPDLKRGNFSEEEVDVIVKLHHLLGNRWSFIAGRLPGRTDNEIKNYWNTHLKRKLVNGGIYPQTHRPFIAAAVSKTSVDSGDSNPKTPKQNLQEDNTNTSTNSSTIDNTTGDSLPPEPILDLELSIGLPSPAKGTAPISEKPKSLQDPFNRPAAGSDTCLCCRLGFPEGCICVNCQWRIHSSTRC